MWNCCIKRLPPFIPKNSDSSTISKSINNVKDLRLYTDIKSSDTYYNYNKRPNSPRPPLHRQIPINSMVYLVVIINSYIVKWDIFNITRIKNWSGLRSYIFHKFLINYNHNNTPNDFVYSIGSRTISGYNNQKLQYLLTSQYPCGIQVKVEPR